MGMMCMTSFLEKTDVEGILCLEHASFIHSLSTFPPMPIMMFSKKLIGDKRSYTIIVEEELDTFSTQRVTERLLVTTPERTIIDMLRYSSDEQFMYESLDRYKRRNPSLVGLYKVSEHYNVTDKLEKALEEVDEWMDDFYNHS